MLQVNFIRENLEIVKQGLIKRGFQNIDDTLKAVLETDDSRKKTQSELDDLLAQSNKLAGEIGQLYKQGKKEEAENKKISVAKLKEAAKILQDNLTQAKSTLEEYLLNIPNIPHRTVPQGKGENDNEVYKAWDKAFPDLKDAKLPHWELAKKYELIDFEMGAKITGAGFPLYTGKGAKLQRALINFFLDAAEEAGYQEVIPPHVVNEASARGTGQLPDKEGQMYHIQIDDLYMIPTAEVPVTNIFRDVILHQNDLPKKLSGYTPCFRREAGSYGAHVRGLNRLHQFDKVEIVRVEHPDKSYDALQEMLKHVEGLLDKLELPYRILRLCGGDIGFTSALTFDFEVYSAAQERWLEVSSVSNFETFQSNRLKLRYKNEKGKKALAHTLNGSALALPRIVAALLENHQTTDGINIPKALWKYTQFEKIS